MTNQFISSTHIEKLGHKLTEIRERALLNIISKLENGYVFDNDLSRTKELLSKLFKWFLFEPCTNEELVISLLKRILLSESGKCILNHYGKDYIIEELKKIRSFIQPDFYKALDDLLESICALNTSIVVPPLECEVPLSYRSNISTERYGIGTTATTVEGFVQKDSSHDEQAVNSVVRNGTTRICKNSKNLALCTLTWQPLITTDKHVLQSVENSLINPPQPASLLHSCEFFTNVLLHDFPSEIFLQRPTILLQFFNLIESSNSTRITNSTLNCLYNLTKELQIRVNHYNDPSMMNLKIRDNNSRSSSRNSNENEENSHKRDVLDINDDETLKAHQITVQKFCLKCVYCVNKYLCAKQQTIREGKPKYNLNGINLSLMLLEEIINLILLTTNKKVWEQYQNTTLRDILTDLNEIFIYFGDVLEYFRVESLSCDKELNSRAIYLCLLHHCVNFMNNFIPIDKMNVIVPKKLKITLTNALMDVTLSKLYPNLYEILLQFVEKFCLDEEIGLYKIVQRICNAITATIKLLKNNDSMKTCDILQMAQQALVSLDFHKNFKFIKTFISISSERLKEATPVSEDVLLRLLAHNLLEIRQETYRLCHKIVAESAGPKSSSSEDGWKICFLLKAKIFQEICLYGISSDNFQIQKYAEEMIIIILKCKIIVCEQVWNQIVETLISIFPILCCYATKKTPLGRTIINILDPDVGKSMLLPDIAIIKSNIQLLYTEESLLREEAFSRLCWLLATQPNSRQTLPRLNNLYDKALANICTKQIQFDVNKFRQTQHFYQPSSLMKILDVLKAKKIEPVIRRSALSQLSVMLEDELLHQIFLDGNGVDLILNVMQVALNESDFHDYPDSIIPAISILKSLCFFHSSVREKIGINIDVFYCILRGLFMFFSEERLKQDAIVLLYLLIMKDYVTGSPSNGDFSLPKLINTKLRPPFTCNSHWSSSIYIGENFLHLLSKNRCCMSSIQIQWNIELFGGINELIKYEEIDYKHVQFPTEDVLKMSNYDLYSLKTTSITFCLDKYLNCIQNGTSHSCIRESLNNLTLYIYLYKITETTSDTEFLQHPWFNSFSRFLKTLPSSDEDQQLLRDVIKVLTLLVPLYKNTDCWIIDLLKDNNSCLLDLLDYSNISDEESKILSQEFLTLITASVCHEQHFLDYFSSNNKEIPPSKWTHIIKIISDNLKFSDAQHFYNLAYLDSLLLCLVHLTASLGWCPDRFQPIPQLINDLTQLVKAFHCGKGATAALSLMGLSITRHVLLILNHLVAELKNCNKKGWEMCFLEDGHIFRDFFTLWNSRDVILRAAVIQLFAGLAESAKFLQEFDDGVLKLALNVVIDNNEASIVKENASLLLANLVNHYSNAIPKKITTLLNHYNFYNCLEFILKSLYLINIDIKKENICEYSLQYHQICQSEKSLSTSSETSESEAFITTPGFVKAVALFLFNALTLAGEEITYKLHNHGLIKLFYRCLHNPSMSLDNTKELALYCSLLEMNTMIVALLIKLIQFNGNCIGIIVHTRDCLNVLLSLLDPKIYYTHLIPLLYLRNKLWCEIFNLLGIILDIPEKNSVEVLSILSDALIEIGSEMFIDTLCLSLNSKHSNDLQNSALVSVTNLLRVETESPKSSMKDLLDTPRTLSSIESSESDYKLDSPLEEIYFDKILTRKKFSTNSNSNDNVVANDLCRILINLYDICNIKQSKHKPLVVAALTGLLCVSTNAKTFALTNNFLNVIFKRLKELYIALSLESVECLRRISDKKRLCPVLKELDELIGMLNNFMVNNEEIKTEAANLGLADLIHKLWIWFSVQNIYLINVLQMLCTFTTNCSLSCKEMPLTSAVAGSGPRKSPTNSSLLHTLLKIIVKEMEQISKTHDLTVIRLTFKILSNCSPFLDCRMILSKNNWLQSILRLHPTLTKHQKPWNSIENIWLEFLLIFTKYPEGQTTLAKIPDVLELIMTLTTSQKYKNRLNALLVLRNLCFYQPNRPRLLASGDFLRILQNKLQGSVEEKNAVVLMVWALIANSQKSKIVLKSADIDNKLKEVLKHYKLCKPVEVTEEDIQRIYYVLSILTDNDKIY